MDASSLNKQQSSSKTYRHFTISSQPAGKKNGQAEFFYIGKNTGKIDFLIKTFGSGYAAENSRRAISILNRIAESTDIPDVIIIDHLVGRQSLIEMIAFISDSSRFSAVPFILDVSGLDNPADLDVYRKLQSIDEIIFLDNIEEDKLKSTINFLKKVKAMPFTLLQRESTNDDPAGDLELKNIIKRIFDIVVSLMLIIFLSPLFLLIAVAIKLESRGPVLYVAQRAGRGYRIFNFYKFRTMVLDADQKVQQLSHLNHYNNHEANGSVFFKVINDSRITKVGAFLRATSMDEIPQFFNVFLGDMSFVGNRPLPLYEAAKLTTDDWAERFMAPAGITGLWQIEKRKHDYLSLEERINLDIDYSKKYNFMYDLWIMANTPSALIQKLNS